MLLRDERSCQAHGLDGRRSASVAGSARGRNLDVAAADKRAAANRSQETNLQRHRPLGFCLPLSASPWRSRCAGDCQAGDRGQMASRRLPFILAMEIESAGWQADSSVGEDTQAYPRDEHCQSAVGSAADPWRTPQARHRYRTDQRDQVHGQATRPAIPSQGWRTFLRNHADGIAAMDLFVVPTISFRLLYGLLIVGHGRRQMLWFGVTAHPTAAWIANQITQACGWEQAPRYLIRDRDGAHGEVLIRRLRSMGIRDRPTSPRSPWQNGYAERLIGSIRRECLDHVIVFGERHLRHLLLCYMKYYKGARTHLSLEKEAPVSRAVDRAGHILCRPILGGLHHQYGRI
jgi:Integrase core domain